MASRILTAKRAARRAELKRQREARNGRMGLGELKAAAAAAKKPTALLTYEARVEQIDLLLAELVERRAEHAKKMAADPGHWGLVGDQAQLAYRIAMAIGGMSGREPNEVLDTVGWTPVYGD